MKENDEENLVQILLDIEKSLSKINLRRIKDPKYYEMNLLMLKYIFFEYFFFEGASKFIDNYERIQFIDLRNQIVATQSNFSSVLFKFVAYLDIKR